MYEKSITAIQAVYESRIILNAPERIVTVWQRMDVQDKHILCRAAGLPNDRAAATWAELTGMERGAVIHAAERARDWVVNLGFVAVCPT